MKNIVFVFLSIFVLNSCTSDDGSLRAELNPILSVQPPEQLFVGQTAAFLVSFNRSSSCHGFLRFDVAVRDNERSIGLIAGKIGENCQPVDEPPRETIFSFTPKNIGIFVFHFFNGKDATGKDTFFTFEIEAIANPNG